MNTIEVLIKAKDEFSRTLNKFNDSINKTSENTGKMAGSLNTLSKGFQYLASGAVIGATIAAVNKLGREMYNLVQIYGQQEQAEVRVEAV